MPKVSKLCFRKNVIVECVNGIMLQGSLDPICQNSRSKS